MRRAAFRFSFWWLLLSATPILSARAQDGAAPLSIGQTFTLASAVLGESRRINVYLPPAYADSATRRLPILYMALVKSLVQMLHRPRTTLI